MKIREQQLAGTAANRYKPETVWIVEDEEGTPLSECFANEEQAEEWIASGANFRVTLATAVIIPAIASKNVEPVFLPQFGVSLTSSGCRRLTAKLETGQAYKVCDVANDSEYNALLASKDGSCLWFARLEAQG